MGKKWSDKRVMHKGQEGCRANQHVSHMLLPVHNRLQVLHTDLPQHTSGQCPAGQQQCIISAVTQLGIAASVVLAAGTPVLSLLQM